MSYKPVKRTAGWGSSRPQRMFQILSILYDNRYPNRADSIMPDWNLDATLTTNQIAKMCGLKPSPHFRGMLDELLGGGMLEVLPEQYRVNMLVYKWRINERARWSDKWKAAFDSWLEPEEVLR